MVAAPRRALASCIEPPTQPSKSCPDRPFDPLPRSPDALREGQVWELAVDDKLEPSLLLELYREGRTGGEHWLCLALESGKRFSATVRRWDASNSMHEIREFEGDCPLVGLRLL